MRIQPTRDARCLQILAGTVIERRIEARAKDRALRRGAYEIEPEDVREAIAKVLHEEWLELPQHIEQEVDEYARRANEAA